MRVRRLVAVATVAALGVISLGACGKSAPDAAAYVGDAKYSVARVDAIYDDAQAKFGHEVRSQASQAGVTPSPDQLKAAVTRQDVVNLLVSIDLGKRVVAEKQFQVADEFSAEQLEQDLRLPAAAEYVQLWAEWLDIYSVLIEKLPPAELSDEALLAVYHAVAKVGAIQPGLSIAEVREIFGEGGFVQSATAVSTALHDAAEHAGTSINPRYRPVGVPSAVNTSQGLVLYWLPYINENGPVTDLSTVGATPEA